MLDAAERNPAYTNLAQRASAPIENSNLWTTQLSSLEMLLLSYVF